MGRRRQLDVAVDTALATVATVLQAGALRTRAPDEPARAAAEDLRRTGCQALAELRDLVGVLAGRRRPVSVVNHRPPHAPDADLTALGTGSGLTGLRHRVDVLGGTFAAGPRPDGGFAVRASLPLRVPDVDGITATAHIARLPRPPRVVALTTFDVDDYVLRALQAGAIGFLLKSTAPEDLVTLVRAAASGATVLSPEATRHLVGVAGDRQRARERIGALTAREAQVLAGLQAGLLAREAGLRSPG